MPLITREHYKTIPDEMRFRGADWTVREIDPSAGLDFIKRHHYAGGASNTAVAVHGLFRYGQGELLGVAWWLPPTKQSAVSVSTDWRNVLSLSRFVIAPSVPKNAATFIQARSMRLLPARCDATRRSGYSWRERKYRTGSDTLCGLLRSSPYQHTTPPGSGTAPASVRSFIGSHSGVYNPCCITQYRIPTAWY